MRIHYLQHVPFEGLGIIEEWISLKRFSLTATKFYENTNFPEIDGFDWLIIMGGPMSVNEEQIYPWLVEEKAFIKRAIESGKTVIGICLGAQLIANVLNAKIYMNYEKEIGWFQVNKTEINDYNVFSDFPEHFLAFHWHGETFDLPKGSINLASSEACKNQAFLYKENVLGLQFHFEMNRKSISTIVKNCKNELVQSKYIQSDEEILFQNENSIKTSNFLMEKILEYFLINEGIH